MAEVTGADRAKAMQVMAWDPLSYEGLAQAVEEGGDSDDRDSLAMVDAIAAALAEEREKARAPFLELAERWEAVAQDMGWARGEHYADCASAIHRVEKESA